MDIIFFICFIAGIIIINLALRHYILLYLHSCKHCGKNMEYKGKKEEDKTYYLFYCPHCNSWEKVPKEDLYDFIDNNSLINL